jgi:hypothetical protein
MANDATVHTVVNGDWTIEIEGLGTHLVKTVQNMPLHECALEAKMNLTGGESVFINSISEQIELVAFYPEAKKAVMRIK